MNIPYTSPRRTDAEIAEIRERAGLYGLAVTDRCRWCGRPVWDPKSLTDRSGPVCRRRNKTRDEKEAA